jgi:hypothetical protein
VGFDYSSQLGKLDIDGSACRLALSVAELTGEIVLTGTSSSKNAGNVGCNQSTEHRAYFGLRTEINNSLHFYATHCYCSYAQMNTTFR